MGRVPQSSQTPGGDRRLDSADRPRRPFLQAVWRLRCPLCNETPLQQNSWFQFRDGCESCDYCYEREPGYFWAAAGVFTYTAASLTGSGIAAVFYFLWPELDILVIAAMAALSIVPFALFLFPYSRALWMWMDFWFHPLEPDEHLTSAE